MGGQDPESINSWLCFFANVPICAWKNRLGPLQYLVRCMLSDLPSFRLPVPHLGQDNMVRNNNMPYLWNSNYLEKCGEGLCHIMLEEKVPTELKVLLTLTGTLMSLLKHTTEDPTPGCHSERCIIKMIYFKLWVLYFHIRNPCAHRLPNMLPIA